MRSTRLSQPKRQAGAAWPRSLKAVVAVWLACGFRLPGQTPYMNRNLVVLDPAHGGDDAGVSIGGRPEKEITLQFAEGLKAQLTAKGFSVIATREGELPSPLTTDQRAGFANHLHPVACLVLHATAAGTGVHLFTSPLGQPVMADQPTTSVPWESAQTAFLEQSERLGNDLGFALLRAKVPVLLTRAGVRPLDNLMCPAVAIEVADAGGDAGAQQRAAETVASALLTWRDLTNPRPAPRPSASAGPSAPGGGAGGMPPAGTGNP